MSYMHEYMYTYVYACIFKCTMHFTWKAVQSTQIDMIWRLNIGIYLRIEPSEDDDICPVCAHLFGKVCVHLIYLNRITDE